MICPATVSPLIPISGYDGPIPDETAESIASLLLRVVDAQDSTTETTK